MRLQNIVKYLTEILVFMPFKATAQALLFIGKKLHLTYNAINIIVWYALLPLAWAGILDYKLHQMLFAPCWALFCISIGILQRKQWNKFCDTMFKLSQIFILSFGNYYLWSVIICLLLPIVITVILLIA